MSKALQGRIAVVSGASAGIGEATAREIVQRGGRVVINGRRAEKLESLKRELGEAAAVCVGDAREQPVAEAMLQTAKDAFGAPADLVVVNAGRGLAAGVLESDMGQWQPMIELNILGAMRLMRLAAEAMLADIERRGDWQAHPHDIVVLGSVVGRHISPFSGAYGVTKYGIHAAAEGLRRELSDRGVRVSLIEPAIVVSEFQDAAGYSDELVGKMLDKFGPPLEPADIARMIALMCEQIPRIHLADLLIRPTRQDYP